MTGDGPNTGPRHEPERIHERAAEAGEQDEADRASGTRGSGQGAER